MAWTHTQSVANSGSTSALNTTITASTQGNIVTVFIKLGSTSLSVSSVTDNKGNTYAVAIGPIDSVGTGLRCYMFYGVQVTGGATTVTVNLTSGSIRVCVDEFNPGVALTSNTGVLDVGSPASALDPGSGTTSASLSLTAAVSAELIVAGIAFASTVTSPTAGANYTLGVNNGNASSEYRLSGTTSETAPISWTGSSRWTEVAVAFTIPSTNHSLAMMGVGS